MKGNQREGVLLPRGLLGFGAAAMDDNGPVGLGRSRGSLAAR